MHSATEVSFHFFNNGSLYGITLATFGFFSVGGSTLSSSHNLDDFISMDPNLGIGDVLNLTEFVKRFFRT